jgi:hypothetical protein
MARDRGYQAVCGVLEQHSTQDMKTELTEVSQQLWFVNHWSGDTREKTFAAFHG